MDLLLATDFGPAIAFAGIVIGVAYLLREIRQVDFRSIVRPEQPERIRMSSADDRDINFSAALRPVGGFPKWGSEKNEGRTGVTADPHTNHGGNFHGTQYE